MCTYYTQLYVWFSFHQKRMTNCVELKHNCNSLFIRENIQLCILPLKAKHNFFLNLFIKFPSLKNGVGHKMTRSNLAFQWAEYKNWPVFLMSWLVGLKSNLSKSRWNHILFFLKNHISSQAYVLLKIEASCPQYFHNTFTINHRW